MPTLRILIPAVVDPAKPSLPTDINHCKARNVLTLNGLNHKNLSVSLFVSNKSQEKEGEDSDVKNEQATKILEYMLNPSIVYRGMPVYGDAILSVTTPSSATFTAAEVLKEIDTVIAQKQSKKMPDTLSTYLNKQKKLYEIKIKKQKDDKLDSTMLEKMLSLVENAINHYGEVWDYAPPQAPSS